MAKLSLPSFVGPPGATQLNTWKSLIEAFAEDTVSLAGVLPNSMTVDLDMDNNDILNVNLIQVQDVVYRGGNIEGLLTAATAEADRAEAEADASAISAAQALASEIAAQDAANSIVGFYDTLAELKADTNIVIGDIVQTYGYHTAGDGGGNLYEIVAAATGTDDGGSFIDLAGSGLQAKGLFPNRVSVKQFGAKGDGVTDDTSAVQGAVSYRTGGGVVRVPEGDYLVTSSINITAQDVEIVGDVPGSGRPAWSQHVSRILWGGAVSGYIFHVDPNLTELVRGVGFRKLIIDGAQTAGVVGVRIEQNNPFFHMEDCVIRRVHDAVLMHTRTTGNWFRNVHVIDFNNVAFDLRGRNHRTTFDGCKADNLNVVSAVSVLRIGFGGLNSSNINCYGCEFQAKGCTTMVDVRFARNFGWYGGYLEGSDTDPVGVYFSFGGGSANQIVEGAFISAYTQMRTGASNYWGRVRQACTGIVIEASSFQGTVNTALIDNQAGGRKHRFSNNFVNGNAVFGGTRRAEGFDEDNFCKRTIADDAAIILTPPTVGGVLVTTFEFYSTRRPGHAGKSYVDAQGAVANIFSLYSSGSVTFTTGILSGTTGVDGDLTVAAHTDGKVYVENRSGTPITFVYKFAGTSDE